MANLPETQQWEDGIYQIEVSDPVLGGPDGITNRPLKQLASRTAYLKQQVEKVVQTWLNTSRQQTHTPVRNESQPDIHRHPNSAHACKQR